ncbi:hypothetical protein [Nonomuraea salmonea]|uniref:hypothetical protein n=1 Tax=Nonomuraea salmonea TaxID=46181 RepID=UPI0031E6513D
MPPRGSRARRRARSRGVGKEFLAALPTDRLAGEARNLMHAAIGRVVSAAGDKVESLTGRLTDYAEQGGGKGLIGALTGSGGSGGLGRLRRFRRLRWRRQRTGRRVEGRLQGRPAEHHAEDHGRW